MERWYHPSTKRWESEIMLGKYKRLKAVDIYRFFEGKLSSIEYYAFEVAICICEDNLLKIK